MNPILHVLKGVFGRFYIRASNDKSVIVIPVVDPVRKVIWRQVNYTGRKIIVQDLQVNFEIEVPE